MARKRQIEEKTAKRTVHIWCEGFSEKYFFQQWARETTSCNILVGHVPSRTTPCAIIKKSLASMEIKENDSVWYVFDVADNSESELLRAVEEINRLRNKYRKPKVRFGLGFTHPAFEAYLALHFCDSFGGCVSADAAKDILLTHIPEYDKSQRWWKRNAEIFWESRDKAFDTSRSRYQEWLSKYEVDTPEDLLLVCDAWVSALHLIMEDITTN